MLRCTTRESQAAQAKPRMVRVGMLLSMLRVRRMVFWFGNLHCARACQRHRGRGHGHTHGLFLVRLMRLRRLHETGSVVPLVHDTGLAVTVSVNLWVHLLAHRCVGAGAVNTCEESAIKSKSVLSCHPTYSVEPWLMPEAPIWLSLLPSAPPTERGSPWKPS